MRGTADTTHRECVEEFDLSYDDMLECAESAATDAQMLRFEQLTTPVMRITDFVPTILYNGRLTSNSHPVLSPNLRANICGPIRNANPACNVTQAETAKMPRSLHPRNLRKF